ncbi:hypothetical protein ACSZNC_11460 [Aeromonas dhakensis]
MFKDRKRIERVNTRLKKAEVFIKYLLKEEEEEIRLFGDEQTAFIPAILEKFASEKEAVIKSANRQKI